MIKKKISVGIIGGLSDGKFLSKIEPLVSCETVNRVYLFRRKGNPLTKYAKVKIISFCSRIASGDSIVSKLLYDICNFCSFFVLGLRKKIDVLVGVYLYQHGFYTGMLGVMLKIPFVLIFPGSDLKIYLETNRYDKLVNKASHIFVRGSNSLNKLIEHGLSEDRVSILPNVYDCPRYDGSAETGKIYDIVSIGYLRQQKRLDVLLNVVSKITKSGYPELKCLIVGDGPLRNDLMALSSKLGTERNVEFIGHTQGIDRYLKTSKIFVLTSDSEGLPMTVIEAMAAKLPVVVSNINDIPDIVEHNHNGYLVEPLNVSEYAHYVMTLLNNDSMRKQMGESGHAKIKRLSADEFSFAAVQQKWLSIISRI